MAELVRQDEARPRPSREAAVEQRVPEEDLPRRAEAGREGVRGGRVAVDVLDANRDAARRPPAARAAPPAAAAADGRRSGWASVIRYGRDEHEQRVEPDEDRGRRDPPALADQPRRGPSRSARRAQQEDELDAEGEPAAEDHLAVARRARRRAGAPTRAPRPRTGAETSQTSPKPSIASSIPVPIGPAADSRMKRAAAAARRARRRRSSPTVGRAASRAAGTARSGRPCGAGSR